ncbi:MAG: DUF305 domain-containing protein [Cryobacterium sp.]|nr:DUF305 domain-containing protein [Cryobacterium sp.]
MKLRTFALASTVLAITLVLAGCSTPSGTPGMDHNSSPSLSSDSVPAFNDADETFVVGMIAHHEQAIEMADLLLDKEGVDERVIDLAFDIKDAQGPEIETMNRWLDDWGIVPDDSGMGMDHGGGMMSDQDMAALEAASAAEASRLFLQQMIQHHEGAIEMAQQELDDGENPDALDLAQVIIDAQTAEIATMQDILATL